VLLDIARGIFPAALAEFGRSDFALTAEFLLNLGFNWQAVAIPTRDVRGVMARHALGLDDEVFEDFV
jgi:hypothetical protein